MTTQGYLKLVQQDLIDGRRMDPEHVLDSWLCDPSTGARIEPQRSTSLETVDRAVQVACEIDRTGVWQDLAISDRAKILERVADLLDERIDDIAAAEAIGTGVVISVTRLFAGSLGSVFRDAAHRIRSGWSVVDLSEGNRPVQLRRLAWGPTVVLVPWNAPTGIAAKKVAYALAAGAPVILKANEWAPYGCNMLADALNLGGIPSGVFQLVHGGADVGRSLVADERIRAIAFTGSVDAGRDIARTAGKNFTALQLELSGNNPVIVLADADLADVSWKISQGMTKLNGQWCEAPRKIIAPTSMIEPLSEALVSQLGKIRIGNHDDPNADFGPLSHKTHRDRVQGQVDRLLELGASERIAGSAPNPDGWFWLPRVILGAKTEDCVDEIFGPVVTLHEYQSIHNAIDEANDSPYGLAAYVFGSDIDTAMHVGSSMRFGEVKINGTSILDLSPKSVQSFWRASGVGGHGDDDVFSFFCGSQIVGLDRDGLPI